MSGIIQMLLPDEPIGGDTKNTYGNMDLRNGKGFCVMYLASACNAALEVKQLIELGIVTPDGEIDMDAMPPKGGSIPSAVITNPTRSDIESLLWVMRNGLDALARAGEARSDFADRLRGLSGLSDKFFGIHHAAPVTDEHAKEMLFESRKKKVFDFLTELQHGASLVSVASATRMGCHWTRLCLMDLIDEGLVVCNVKSGVEMFNAHNAGGDA